MKNKYLHSLCILLVISLVSCSDSESSFQHIVVKSDRQGILLDSTDSKVLETLAKIFNNKEEAPDAGPEYTYLVDITTSKITTRWQYSKDGYIRNFEIDDSMIYYMPEYPEFNRTTNIR
jgi:hypothetical protein